MGFAGKMAFEAVGITTLLFTHLTVELEFLKAFRFYAIANIFWRALFSFRHGGVDNNNDDVGDCLVGRIDAETSTDFCRVIFACAHEFDSSDFTHWSPAGIVIGMTPRDHDTSSLANFGEVQSLLEYGEIAQSLSGEPALPTSSPFSQNCLLLGRIGHESGIGNFLRRATGFKICY